MIELQHLTKRFATQGGTVIALNDINLTIRDGDVYGIIGMSGAGKSTLVRCINMLERPDEGKVIVNGKQMQELNAADLRAARREITMIFQQFNLLMQVRQLKRKGLDEKQIAEKTGLRSFVVRKYVSQSARFTWEELKEALTACVETEEAVKTGQMNDRMSVELLIIAYSGEKERRA